MAASDYDSLPMRQLSRLLLDSSLNAHPVLFQLGDLARAWLRRGQEFVEGPTNPEPETLPDVIAACAHLRKLYAHHRDDLVAVMDFLTITEADARKHLAEANND